jgi:transposase-like protein
MNAGTSSGTTGIAWARPGIAPLPNATSLTLSELAKTFGVNHDATIAMAVRRYKNGLARNPRERKMMEAAAEKLRIRM